MSGAYVSAAIFKSPVSAERSRTARGPIIRYFAHVESCIVARVDSFINAREKSVVYVAAYCSVGSR